MMLQYVSEKTTNIGSNGVAGTWSSSNEQVATIDNFGVITGIGAGIAEFTFTDTDTQCESEPSDPVIVHPAPVLSLSDNAICLEETAFATTSAFTGTWTSEDTDVATINPFTGDISPIAPGSTFFTFVDNNGCSAQTGLLVVNETPIVEFPVTDEICVNETTNVSPTTGGTWESSDITVATVGPTGVVTGIGAGTAELTFTETLTGCASASLTVTVNGSVDVSIDGDDELCIGETTNLLPNTGGTWSSNDGSIATVTPAGLVTAVSSGSTTFIFTSDAGQCTSSNSPPVIVNPNPTISFDDFEVCVGETAQASTATSGTWTSTNPGIASIDPVTGEITGVAIGTTTFTFVDGATMCSSPESALFTVAEPEDVSINNLQICVGEQTNVFPSTDGTWESSDPSIATVTNEGVVQGVSPGKVVFRFTQNAGCTSSPTDSLEVTPGPDTDIGPDNQLCIGDDIQILPASGGTWTSSNPAVATITDAGFVVAVGAGTATFTFESSTTGCQSVPSDPITVDAPVTTVITGSTTICIGGTTQLTPDSGGTWVSTNEAVATIDDSGEVLGISSGTATFIFTPDNTGCPSNESDPVSVSLSPDAEITGLTEICIGAFTTLSPTAGGTWTSSDPTVASVTDNGVVTALASGVVSFTFNETATGCDSEASTGDLTISNCINPDFNATFVDIPVDGNVETNDNTPVGTTYGPTPVYTGGPAGAVFSISINSDGSYTFESNTVGVYTWDVPVCIPDINGPITAGCQVSELVITVVDFLQPDLRPIANVDITTTPINTAVEINSLANDKCVVVGGCDLDPNISIVTNPSNGTVAVDVATGNTTYTPDNNFVGHDTLRYSVCVDGDASNCAEANQIITILSSTAVNTTVAADDFNSGAQDTPIIGNVSDNDYDPEGDTQMVTPQTTTNAAGTLVLLADGSYEFTPTETFYGAVDFPYTTCDDNVDVACTDATLHILVVRDIYIQLRVYLEGAFINNLNEVGTTHERPLMRDDLRKSSFTGARYIPDEEPYASSIMKAQFWETVDNPSIYDAYSMMSYDYTAMDDKFKIVPDPATIFGVEGEDAVVDWISVELRSKNDNTLVIASRSALVQRDGDVIDLNGELGVRFKGLEVDDYYIVVRHRLHLGAMTAVAKTPEQYADLVDFTIDETGFFDFGTSKGIEVNGVTIDFAGLAQATLGGSAVSNKNGYRALWAGDLDKNGRIKFTQPDDDLNLILNGVFLYEIVPGVEYNFYTNFDFAFGYQAGDYDMNSKTKFDNPNDDKNYLFGQVLFYPLNNEFRSNFDFFIEQIPENLPTK